jgi:hypothetical protein
LTVDSRELPVGGAVGGRQYADGSHFSSLVSRLCLSSLTVNCRLSTLFIPTHISTKNDVFRTLDVAPLLLILKDILALDVAPTSWPMLLIRFDILALRVWMFFRVFLLFSP